MSWGQTRLHGSSKLASVYSTKYNLKKNFFFILNTRGRDFFYLKGTPEKKKSVFFMWHVQLSTEGIKRSNIAPCLSCYMPTMWSIQALQLTYLGHASCLRRIQSSMAGHLWGNLCQGLSQHTACGPLHGWSRVGHSSSPSSSSSPKRSIHDLSLPLLSLIY